MLRRPCKEVAQVDKVAMSLVLYIDDTPLHLSAADGFAIDDDVSLRSDDGERDH